MPHIEIDIDFMTHPKVIALDPLSQLLFLRSLQYAARHLTDGFIPAGALPLLTYDFGPYAAISTTVANKPNEWWVTQLCKPNGLWETHSDGWIIHDYLDFQLSKHEVKQMRERRAKSNRKNGVLGGRPRKPNGNPTHIPNITQINPPIPCPIPCPIPFPLSDSDSLSASGTGTDALKEVKSCREVHKPSRRIKPEAVSAQSWEAYSHAYRCRYGVDPVRHAGINSMLAKLVEKIGAAEAPLVASYYLTHTNRWYLEKMHPVNLLVSDAEKLRTEWATGRNMTTTEARKEDGKSARGQMWQRLIDKDAKKGEA